MLKCASVYTYEIDYSETVLKEINSDYFCNEYAPKAFGRAGNSGKYRKTRYSLYDRIFGRGNMSTSVENDIPTNRFHNYSLIMLVV